MSPAKPHVVIIGGGFGGIYAARALKRAPVRVTLIDRQNHHLFQPLLYQVATAALSSPDIAGPIRKILERQKNATVLMGEVISVDLDENFVCMESEKIEYDYLIIAAGVRTSYFGRKQQWRDLAPGLKTLEDALEIRRRVLLAYEAAERCQSEEERRAHLNFVIVGGGPTGVELAGALSEIAQRTMARNFRNFDPADARVILIEGSERLLTMMSEKLSARARKDLESLGVEVITSTMVADISRKGVTLDSGEFIEASTVLWAAGVSGGGLAESLGVELSRAKRIVVDSYLRIPDHPNVFVVGDLAACTDGNGVEVPALAPAAIQQGRYAGKSIRSRLADKEVDSFHYRDKGQMATLGRSKAVAMTGPFEFGGFLAWIAWLFIHLLFLIGFRNRFAVLMGWMYAYLSYQRSARIVVEPRTYRPTDAWTLHDDAKPALDVPEIASPSRDAS